MMAPGFTPPRLLRHADVQAALANSGWRRKLVLGEADSLLAAWDTSLVTDGDYHLRLRVTLQDGSILESIVTGLRIRNQLPTETPALTATPELDPLPLSSPLPPTPQPAPTSTHIPTPTPLPPNPAAVTQPEITSSLTRGLIIAFLAFLIIGLFLRLRR